MKAADLIKALEQLNPDAMVIIEAHNHRKKQFAEDTASVFLDITDFHPTYVLSSRAESLGPVRFKAATKNTAGAKEVIFIEATDRF